MASAVSFGVLRLVAALVCADLSALCHRQVDDYEGCDKSQHSRGYNSIIAILRFSNMNDLRDNVAGSTRSISHNKVDDTIQYGCI